MNMCGASLGRNVSGKYSLLIFHPLTHLSIHQPTHHLDIVLLRVQLTCLNTECTLDPTVGTRILGYGLFPDLLILLWGRGREVNRSLQFNTRNRLIEESVRWLQNPKGTGTNHVWGNRERQDEWPFRSGESLLHATLRHGEGRC